MILRRLSQSLREQNWTAIVIEFLLVVIGVFLGIQVSNWNQANVDRARELGYLHNIREDVAANIRELDGYLTTREQGIATARRILEHYNGKPIADISTFNADSISIYNWKRFYLGDNTYQELIGSGNFALLSNAKVKDGLLDIEAMYRKLKGEEDHFRFDSETLLYRPIYATTDLGPMLEDYEFRMSKGQAGRGDALHAGHFDTLLHNLEAKNGFWMVILEFDAMNEQMRAMRDRSRQLLADIDTELKH
ncbi:MAG: hypothetical protein JSR65_08690 [Proteobacteria bacterium]|nr:hypothetical protein [Pseudomonadota bacterium]